MVCNPGGGGCACKPTQLPQVFAKGVKPLTSPEAGGQQVKGTGTLLVFPPKKHAYLPLKEKSLGNLFVCVIPKEFSGASHTGGEK